MTQTESMLVHRHIRAFLTARAPGERVRIVSACAGQGRELLPVLAAHPGRADVSARLVELDPRNVAAASDAVSEARLDWNVEIIRGDASFTDAYAGAVPADLILLGGIFGCISGDDVLNTIELLPELCAPGATVVWTHQRRVPDPVPRIRQWFEQSGFREEAFESLGPDVSWVGIERFTGEPRPLSRGVRLFVFPGEEAQNGN